MIVLTVLAGSARAHHSQAGTFDSRKTIEISCAPSLSSEAEIARAARLLPRVEVGGRESTCHGRGPWTGRESEVEGQRLAMKRVDAR